MCLAVYIACSSAHTPVSLLSALSPFPPFRSKAPVGFCSCRTTLSCPVERQGDTCDGEHHNKHLRPVKMRTKRKMS